MNEEVRRDRTELENYVREYVVKNYGPDSVTGINKYLNSSKWHMLLRDVISDVVLSTLRHDYAVADPTVKVFQRKQYERQWGRISLNKKLVWINSFMPDILFDIVYSGTTNVASAVRVKEKTMDALMEMAIESQDNFIWKYEAVDPVKTECHSTVIDHENLRRAIKIWEHLPEKPKVLRNIATARAILANLDNGVLHQPKIIADSGRTYLTGLNLQNCPKAVRHAALGKCHLYDIRVCAFGVMAGLATYYAKELEVDVKFLTIRDYISRKIAFRTKITTEVFPEETSNMSVEELKNSRYYKSIKNALTSIGFGAKRSATAVWKDQNNNWKRSSLSNNFSNKEELTRFLENPTAIALMDEYETAVGVVELWLENDSNFRENFNLDTKTTRGERIALVYQSFESFIMDRFSKFVGRERILLPVHDGVYTATSIDLASAYSRMFLIPGDELAVPYIPEGYIQFDHELINNGAAHNPEREHRESIAIEESVAQHYQIRPECVDNFKVVRKKSTPWGDIDEQYLPKSDNNEYYRDPYYNAKY